MRLFDSCVRCSLPDSVSSFCFSSVNLPGFKAPEVSLPRSPGQYKEWIGACKGGPAALSNFDYSAQLTEAVLLGNLAVRLGGKVNWDAKNMKVTGRPEADPLIKRAYRPGYMD